jgi:hypothetical protein
MGTVPGRRVNEFHITIFLLLYKPGIEHTAHRIECKAVAVATKLNGVESAA